MSPTRTTRTAGRDVAAELAFLTRALKAPTLREAVPRLADRAREQSWTHEEFLAACLQREVAAREAHGGEGRIRAARFPARKSLEEFDFDHASNTRALAGRADGAALDRRRHGPGRQAIPPRQRPPAPARPARRARPDHRCCHTHQGGCRLITRRAATQLPRRAGHPRCTVPSSLR